MLRLSQASWKRYFLEIVRRFLISDRSGSVAGSPLGSIFSSLSIFHGQAYLETSKAPPWARRKGTQPSSCPSPRSRAYKPLMSQSELSTPRQKSLQKQKSPTPPSSPRERESPPPKPPRSPAPIGKLNIEDSSGLYEENRKLRRKLKELSSRLDEELVRAAEVKLRQLSQRGGHPASVESQSLELQNAYKMIERLQKAVKDYESKEMYHVTLKRVMDLEGIIRKKDEEMDLLRTEIKTQKRIVKEREKHIEELIENSKKLGNPTEDLEAIAKLKGKLKKLAEEGEALRRKELEKHEKLVKAEHRIVELEQAERQPLSAELQGLQRELEESRGKYKDAVQRLERQNIYIGKLNEKLAQQPKESKRQAEHKHYSVSLDELPRIKPNIRRNELTEQLNSPTARAKRY